MGIDRQELYRTLNLPPETLPIESVFTERQYWRGEVPDQMPSDPGTARALLERAGWTKAGAGMWMREGEPLEITAPVDVEDAIVRTAAVHVQDKLGDVGVRMKDAAPGRPRRRVVGWERRLRFQ